MDRIKKNDIIGFITDVEIKGIFLLCGGLQFYHIAKHLEYEKLRMLKVFTLCKIMICLRISLSILF